MEIFFIIEDRQQKVETLFIELGAKKIEMTWGYCYSKGNIFYKTDIVQFPIEPFIVIETANSIEDAENQIFEDDDTFPLISLNEEELLKEVKYTLLNCDYGF